MANILRVFDRPELPPWSSKNKAVFVVGAVLIFFGAEFVIGAALNKMGGSLPFGLNHGSLILVGLALSAVGLVLAGYNRHS